MSEQNNCMQEPGELLLQLSRLCDVIEAQTKAISEFAVATAGMQAAMSELQGELAAHLLNDGDGEDGAQFVYLDD